MQDTFGPQHCSICGRPGHTRRTCPERVLAAAGDAGGLLRYTFPLRPDQDAVLLLPRDLTPGEAEKVAVFVRALALPAQEDTR